MPRGTFGRQVGRMPHQHLEGRGQGKNILQWPRTAPHPQNKELPGQQDVNGTQAEKPCTEVRPAAPATSWLCGPGQLPSPL